jgi:Trypsin
VIHPDYNRDSKVYDIALVMLKISVNVTEFVRPICLWMDDYDMDMISGQISKVSAVTSAFELFCIKKLQVFGWGYTENHTLPDELQTAELTVLSHRECYLWEKNFFGKYLIPGKNFCAKGDNGNFCCSRLK